MVPILLNFTLQISPFLLGNILYFHSSSILFLCIYNVIRRIRFDTETSEFGVLEGRDQIIEFLFGNDAEKYQQSERKERIKMFKKVESLLISKLGKSIDKEIKLYSKVVSIIITHRLHIKKALFTYSNTYIYN